MDLKGICSMAMVNGAGDTIIEDADNTADNAPRIRFHQTATFIPTTFLAELVIPAQDITGLWQTYTSNDTTGATGTFTTIASLTATTAGTAYFFSIVNGNGTLPTDRTTGDVVLTGSVGTSGEDINFNTVDWDSGDNISITALSFHMPK